MDDYPEAMMAEAMREQEEMALDALTRCAQSGADPEALQTLAALIGVSREWARTDAAHPRTRTGT